MDLREIPAVDYSEYEEHHEVTMEEDDSELPPLRSLLAPSRVPPLPAHYQRPTMTTTTTSGTTMGTTRTTMSTTSTSSASSSSLLAALHQVCISIIGEI